jgi:hypothetical protein
MVHPPSSPQYRSIIYKWRNFLPVGRYDMKRQGINILERRLDGFTHYIRNMAKTQKTSQKAGRTEVTSNMENKHTLSLSPSHYK